MILRSLRSLFRKISGSPNRYGTESAKDVATSLYRGFVLERIAEGFQNEANQLPIELRQDFSNRVDLYREALLLMVLIDESKAHERWEQVLQEYEAHIFGETPTDAGFKKLDTVKAAMSGLSRLLSSDGNGRELTWGMEWFREIGYQETNPIRLGLFASKWMDEFTALLKVIQDINKKT